MTEQNGRIHSQTAELLSAYIDGEVTSDERALIEAHLASCAACAQDLATLRQTVTLLKLLPQVAAPRPFTLREADVRPAGRPARAAWWRLPWAQGLAAAAAMLMCVVIVVGVLLLGRPGKLGAPAAPAPIARQAPTTSAAIVENMAAEKAAPTEAAAAREVEVTKEVEMTVEAAAPAPAAQEATAELKVFQEMPAEAPQAETEAAADEAAGRSGLEPPRAAAGAAPTPSPMPSPAQPPSAIPTATAETLEMVPALTPTTILTPTLLQVEDLSLHVEPGVIRVSGRLPLPEGRKLLAELWRGASPIEWARPESQQGVVEANGQFYLELQALADIPDLDLFAVEAAYYELRIRPVDPPEPVEARIPFDTYGPPAAPPTNSP